jgi:hypothetical protein
MADMDNLDKLVIDAFIKRCEKKVNKFIEGAKFIESNANKKSIDEEVLAGALDAIKGEKTFTEIIDRITNKVRPTNLTPDIFISCYERNPSNAIKLMKNYIISNNNLEREIRLNPLRRLLSKQGINEVFKENSFVFVNDALPAILKCGWLKDFQELGIRFSLESYDCYCDYPSFDWISLKINDNEEFSSPIISDSLYKELRQNMDQFSLNEVDLLRSEVNQ